MTARALFLAAIGVAAAFSAYASDEPEEIPARPVYPKLPTYPAACEPAATDPAPSASVTVVYEVTADGRPRNVRVRESSDPCFDDTAIAAIRNWDFEPRRVNGRRMSQEDLETTFVFILEEETQAVNFDARPKKRVPPTYPSRCMRGAEDIEAVLVTFDVTEQGETDNIEVADTSNDCLDKSAIEAVEQWTYRPKLVDGEPVRREGVETLITFQLASGYDPAWRVRSYVRSELNRARRDAVRRSDTEKAMARLEKVEERYGINFSQAETAEYYYSRAVIRIEMKDYRGALDDLRIVQSTGVASTEMAGSISETIANLEIYLAQQDAAPQAEAEDE